MSSARRPTSRWGIVPRSLLLAGGIAAGLGLFFAVLAGALIFRAHLQHQADAEWKPPTTAAVDNVARQNAIALGAPAAALAPGSTPTTPADARQPKPIALWAQQARLSGSGITLSGKRDPIIADWRGAKATASWPVNPVAGEYHVDVTYAVRATEGGDFTVTVGGQTLKGNAGPTDAQKRVLKSASFTTVRLGTIKLPDGATTLTVAPDGAPDDALMSLLRVDLIPPGSPGENAAVVIRDAVIDDGTDGDGVEHKLTPEEKAELNLRRKREAERVAAAVDEMKKWKQVAADREAFDRQQKELKQAEDRKAEQERKEKRDAERLAMEAAKAPKPVETFQLVDAKSGDVLAKLNDGAIVNLATVPRDRITIVAQVDDPKGRVKSVRFALDGNEKIHTENVPPYVATDGAEGMFGKPLPLNPGKHTIAATTFASRDANGAAAKPYSITFTATDEPKIGEAAVITTFTLIDCDTGIAIRPLADGAKLDLSALPKKLTIRAETAGEIGSVRFELSRPEGDTFQHIENNAPYALLSDHAGKYIEYPFAPGKYKLVTVPFEKGQAQGKEGKRASAEFEVTGQGK